MKQGRASRTTYYPPTNHPSVRVVHPGGVDQMGQQMGNHTDRGDTGKGNPATPVFGGKGFEPGRPAAQHAGPGGGRTVHHSGSQGKHR